MLDTLLAHWAIICQIARAQLPPGDQTRRNLESAGVLKNCEDLLCLFDPVANALNSMQRNTTTLGQAVELWIDLIEKIPRNLGGRDDVIQRSKQALECPFFLLANALDPRFAGARLTPEQLDKARQFSEEEGPEVAQALNLYLARANPFRQGMFHPNADPVAWWHAGQMSGFPPALCSLAIRLSCCLASTASLERNFSTLGFVYGQKRTLLGVEKAGKLTFLFRALNSADAPLTTDSDSE